MAGISKEERERRAALAAQLKAANPESGEPMSPAAVALVDAAAEGATEPPAAPEPVATAVPDAPAPAEPVDDDPEPPMYDKILGTQCPRWPAWRDWLARQNNAKKSEVLR